MREAAYQVCDNLNIEFFSKIIRFPQAGIASREFPDQLLIALEPEAASIYIRKLRMHQFVPDETSTVSRNNIRREHDTLSSSVSNQSSPTLCDPDKCQQANLTGF